MTNISVELVDSMGDDLAVSNAARVSFNKWKEEFDEQDARLIDYLARCEHFSPFRHTAISIRCKAPVFLSRQLGKHQAGLSWNEVSRRYVDSPPEFFIPGGWRNRPVTSIKQGSGTEFVRWVDTGACIDQAGNLYEEFLSKANNLYETFMKAGIAPEMARMVLPQSMMVDWIWTGNLLSFFHVYRMRIGGGAQVEAQEFAQKLKDVIQPLFPHCFEALESNATPH